MQPRRTPGEPQQRRTPAELEAAPPHRCTAAGSRQSLGGSPPQSRRGRKSLHFRIQRGYSVGFVIDERLRGKKISHKYQKVDGVIILILDFAVSVVWLDRLTGRICMSISAKAMTITGIEDRRYWNWLPTKESRLDTWA
nr:F-box protein PP2-A15 [Ipomoea batatas]